MMYWLLILFPFFGMLSPENTESKHAATIDRDFPSPDVKGLLFYIQRDPNTNTICYEINIDRNGKLNQSIPVKPYWIRYAEDGARAELNYIQRTFAYGIKSKAISNDEYDVRAVAYPKHKLTLKKGLNDEYQIFTRINDKESILKRIFIRIDGGSFWSPNVLYIELSGTDSKTGQSVRQRIKPEKS